MPGSQPATTLPLATGAFNQPTIKQLTGGSMEELTDFALQDFKVWWESVGSGITPLPLEDQEEHAKRVAYLAWLACIEG